MGEEPEWEKRELLERVRDGDAGGADGGEASVRL